MFRSISIVAAVVGLLAVGALSALAGNPHEAGVSSTTVKSGASSGLAKAMGQLTSAAARLDESAVPSTKQAQAQTQAQAEPDSDTADEATDEDANDVTDENADEDTGEVSAAAPAPAPTTQSEQQGAEQDD